MLLLLQKTKVREVCVWQCHLVEDDLDGCLAPLFSLSLPLIESRRARTVLLRTRRTNVWEKRKDTLSAPHPRHNESPSSSSRARIRVNVLVQDNSSSEEGPTKAKVSSDQAETRQKVYVSFSCSFEGLVSNSGI